MNTIQKIISLLILTISCSVTAQESAENKTGFISDDLFIYFHSGPGTQYRILGSINAGEEVQLLGAVENEYQQVQDAQNRTGWVDAKYISATPGLRVVLAELNEELADKTAQLGNLQSKMSETNKQLNALKQQNQQITKENQEISQKFEQASSELDEKDLDLKLTWFTYGAGVLVLGLILGLILPRFASRKSSYSSWG
ncbi:TIGR04211 family SH3 domain-containing protein [Thalassotalea nanhaiensis]|uniref:TIGR04211 family SH3 domain-containing protein n=1 Tax=Thalassotalea nanhaiensis TaxID=3065648 RepID=A0ABY9TJG2_9GAMM|nr:TIGR04211 family SH3 domain-containing protein [Colwelliaceae bacterium SQ345]